MPNTAQSSKKNQNQGSSQQSKAASLSLKQDTFGRIEEKIFKEETVDYDDLSSKGVFPSYEFRRNSKRKITPSSKAKLADLDTSERREFETNSGDFGNLMQSEISFSKKRVEPQKRKIQDTHKKQIGPKESQKIEKSRSPLAKSTPSKSQKVPNISKEPISRRLNARAITRSKSGLNIEHSDKEDRLKLRDQER